jgi:signal transduction histidine kinase
LGLIKGLKSECENICKKAGLKFAFVDRCSQVPLDDNRKILIFRCVQELMRNIVKHAKATEVMLSVRMISNLLEIELCDNGVGFDPSALESRAGHQGFGLFSVQERISSIKGDVKINSKLGAGTCITLAILAN